MFSKLFRKRARFDSPDPELRQAAIEALTSAELEQAQNQLRTLATDDPVAAVRCTAVRRLTLIADLTGLLDDADPEVREETSSRLADLSTADPAMLGTPQVRQARLRGATDVGSIEPLLQDLDQNLDSAAIVALAVDARHPDVRLAIAAHVIGEANHSELERRTRSRDKRVNRLARTRLDEIRSSRVQHTESLKRAEQLLASIGRFAATDPQSPDPQTPDRLRAESQLEALLQSWQTHYDGLLSSVEELRRLGDVLDSTDALQLRFVTSRDQARNRVQALAAAAPEPPRGPDFDAVMADLRSLESQLKSPETDLLEGADAFHSQYLDLVQAWSSESDRRPPTKELADEFHAVTHSFAALFESAKRLSDVLPDLGRLLNQLPDKPSLAKGDPAGVWRRRERGAKASDRLRAITARIHWTSEFPTPETLIEAERRQQFFEEFVRSCDDRVRDLLTTGRALIKQLDEDIAGGNLDTAIKRDQELRAALRALPAAESQDLREHAYPLEARLQELTDWRNYATSPKREALLEQMRALIGIDREPAELADQIKALRDAWNQLGPATERSDRTASSQFNQAAEEAFTPCREFYAAQAAIRESNLAERRSICDALEQYLQDSDWTQTDYKSAEQILRTARDEWRRFHPVDRAPGRDLATRFEQLTADLHGHIKAQWDRNIARKEALIEEAGEAVNSESASHDATEKVKQLQRRWREVGPIPRGVDQRLWKSFRALCDSAFTRRDAHLADQQQLLNDHLTDATSLCDEFQTRIDTDPINAAAESTLRDFQRRFGDIGELPGNRRAALRKRFEDLERTYHSLLRESAQLGLIQELERWRAADETLTTLEHQIATGGTAEVPENDRLGVDPVPLERRLRDIAAGSFNADPNAAIERRQLTVDTEIRAGLESPEVDGQLRLERQVERLNRGLHSDRIEPEPVELAVSWCALGSAAPPDDAELRDRFFTALKAIAS